MRFSSPLAAALILVPILASAAGGQDPIHSKTSKRKKAPAASASASPPAPPTFVHLTIEPSTEGPIWKMHLANSGEVPVKVLADPRLLSFEGHPNGSKRAVVCNLPAPMQPSANELMSVVLAGGRSYSAAFDVRKYCFHEEATLIAAGTQITAHYGVHDGTDTKDLAADDTAAVSAIEGVQPPAVGARNLVATFTAPEVPKPADAVDAHASKAGDAGEPPELELSSPGRIDSESPYDVVLPVTLRNRSDHSVHVRFRPETLAFDVVSPNGIEQCVWPNRISSPTHEAFDLLGPKQELTLDIELGAYCKEHSFDASGLLVVRPHMDTRAGSGKPLGIPSFDGEVVTAKTTLIRLYTGRVAASDERPKVDASP